MTTLDKTIRVAGLTLTLEDYGPRFTAYTRRVNRTIDVTAISGGKHLRVTVRVGDSESCASGWCENSDLDAAFAGAIAGLCKVMEPVQCEAALAEIVAAQEAERVS